MRKHLLTMLLLCIGVVWSYGQRTVTGSVSDENGEPLIGVTVTVKGTAEGTITDLDGTYSIDVPDDVVTLVFSYIGLETIEQEVAAGQSTVDVTMREDSEILDEVVVTALGFEQQKSKMGVASSTVEGDQLQNTGETRLINQLAGKSAGVNIIQATGDPGAGSKIQIRGATSVLGNLQPLIVVDGVPIFNDSYYGEGFGGQDPNSSGSLGSGGGVTQQSRLNDIAAEDIESVEILRGASAAALWGSRAANGVIVITTKKGRNTAKDFQITFNTSVMFDEVNKEVELQDRFGQGAGGTHSAGTQALSWGDKISDRAGGADMSVTAPGQFFIQDDDGNLIDLYGGKFTTTAENAGTEYYSVLPSNSEIYDANGTLLMETDEHGGKQDRSVYSPYDNIFETGVTFNNQLGITTGGDKGSVYFSIGHMNQDGVIKQNSTYDRTTVRLNATRQLGDKFTVLSNISYVNTNSDRVQMGSNLNGLFLGGLRSAADFNDADYVGTYEDATGTEFSDRQRAYRNPLGANTNSIYDNPVWMMNNITSTSAVDRVYGKMELRYEPLNWLNITARGGLDTYTDEREDFYPVLSAGTNNGGRFMKETITRTQTSFDLIARARFDLTSDISLNALVGGGINQVKLDDHGTDSRSFVNPLSPPQLNNASNIVPFNYEEQIRTSGIYANVGLEFFDQVFVNLSARNDWLSVLPEDDNSVFYPAVDAAWEFTKVVETGDILTYGKLRAGWGQVGRGPDPYITTTGFFAPTAANTGWGEGWGPGVNPNAYGGAFAVQTISGNPNIKPEIKTEFEIGTDLRLWKNRVNLSYTYYQNEVKDAILPVDLPESSGFLSVQANAATIENKGHEVELGVDVLRKRDFTWNVYGNYTRNRNEVTDMSGTNSLLLSGFAGGSSRAVVGEQIGALWGGQWAREDDGSFTLDENGFPTIAGAAGVIGDPNPDFRAGIGTVFSWKHLTVNALFDMAQGMDMWNGTRGALAFFGRAESTAVETTLSAEQATTLTNYVGMTAAEMYPWLENGDGTYTIRGEVRDFGGGDVLIDETYYYVGPGSGFTGPEEEFVEDASWSRLRALSLSYRIGDDVFGNSNFIESLTVTLTGRNLILWTDYTGNDPDQNLTGAANNGFGLDYFQNPSTRSYQIALNFTF